MPDNNDAVKFRRFHPDGYRWEGVELQEYKEHKGEKPGEGWRDITRQVIAGRFGEPCSFRLRYFEVGPGGFSSLEKHEHIHVVMTIRGQGKVIVGDDVYDARPLDLIYVPPLTPHQFVNEGDEPFGFLCIVDADRDRPQPLSPEELERLRSLPHTAAVMRVWES